MDKITAVGLDLAKQIIRVHGIDVAGRVVLRNAPRRTICYGISEAAFEKPCELAHAQASRQRLAQGLSACRH